MVHFRNIKGGYCDFSECFPDEGDVDMLAAVRAYREVGYRGILCPDHVPASDLDPARARFFAFALGYTRGLLQAACGIFYDGHHERSAGEADRKSTRLTP